MILALDTSSAQGSTAIVSDGAIVAEHAGDASRTHGVRLPGDLIALLEDARVTLAGIETFAIATGPGSFTGLRIGIAAIQGLALAQGKLVVPISTFEALAADVRLKAAATHERASNIGLRTSDVGSRTPELLAVWIDAHRGEVFATLYAGDGVTVLQPPTSLPPEATLDAWSASLAGAEGIRFAGDGALKYRGVVEERLGTRARLPDAVPPLAGTVGLLAASQPERAVRPHAIVPIYVRRSDAELARDRLRPAGGA